MHFLAELMNKWNHLPLEKRMWIVIGFLGQAMFFGRFFVQWIATERAKKMVIPVSFWFLSIAGGAILLAYAISLKDPVFIVGQTTGLFIYFRNLYFVRREEREKAAS